MRDRFLLPLMVLTGLGLIALSLQWPQGQGAPSRAPFTEPLAPVDADEPPPPPTEGLTPSEFARPKTAAPAPAAKTPSTVKTPAKPAKALDLRPAQ